MMNEASPKRKRELYFDILWVISILVMIFSYSGGVNVFEELEVATLPHYISVFLMLFVRFPLWLCLMITGAILLDMHEPIRVVWKHRILRLLITLIIFSFLYHLNEVRLGKAEFDLTRFIPDLYAREQITQFWYLYAVLGFMVCLPFMRPMVKNMRDVDFIYLIMLVFILSSVLPLFDLYVLKNRYNLNPNTKLEWVKEVIFIYPVMGYYFHHRLSKRKCRKLAMILIPVDLAWMVYNTYILIYSGISMGDMLVYPAYHSSVTMLHCVTLFVTAKGFFKRKERTASERVIGSLGGCSFGIYLLEGFFFNARIDFIEKFRLAVIGESMGLEEMGRTMLWCVIVYLVCLIPVWIIRRIPKLRDMTL